MTLTLRRQTLTSRSTIGALEIDGAPTCWTLEDPVRPDGVKVPGETAIPAGRYRILVTWSPRFRRCLPVLLGVPGFAGVRLHTGNSPLDTAGCILVGLDRAPDWIARSREAYDALVATISPALDRGEEVWLTVEDAPVSPEMTA